MTNDISFTDLMPKAEHQRRQTNTTYISIDELIENENNVYELVNIDEMAKSIETMGLLEPLIVKKIDKYNYKLVAGHRRYNAIKKLISDGKLDADYEVLCTKIVDNEDELVTRLKLHETNLQARSLTKLPEKTKVAIVDDYLDIISQAREQGLEINGKKVKGKTRDLLAERFNISPFTAQKLINKTKGEEESEAGVKKPQTSVSKLTKLFNQLQKIEFDNSAEEEALKEEIAEFLMK